VARAAARSTTGVAGCPLTRSSFRTTSFSPDHTSSTAHTFTSTSPSGSATSRTTSSVTSVATFDAFFGHDTHTTASARIFRRIGGSAARSRARLVTKRCVRSVEADSRGAKTTPSGKGDRSDR